MMLRSAGLILVWALQVANTDELSCDFIKPCCWKSLDDNYKWQVRSSSSINLNDYRRTFIVGRTRSPPAGNYLIQNGNSTRSSFGSCMFCSSDGEVNIQYRYWQSPTVQLKVCWRIWGQPIRNQNCYLTKPSRQSQIISQNLDVPRGKHVQVLFIMEKDEGAINGIVMIDRIVLTANKCGTLNTERSTGSISQVRRVRTNEENHRTSNRSTAAITSSEMSSISNGLDVVGLSWADKSIRNEFIKESEKQLTTINRTNDLITTSKQKHLQRKSGEVARYKTDRFRPTTPPNKRFSKSVTTSENVLKTKSRPSTMLLKKSIDRPSKRFLPQRHRAFNTISRNMPPPSPPARVDDSDPLTQILGKEFVEFLDPNYVTKDDEQDVNYEDTEDFSPNTSVMAPLHFQRPTNDILTAPKVRPTAVQSPSLLMKLIRPLSLLPPQPCHTVGGCLFDKSMCSYTHPADIPPPIQFQPVRVGMSNFIRARVPPGMTSTIQTNTLMDEAYTIYFDALEWKSGARLIGCCENVNGEQHCPYSTPFEAGVVLWQSASFDCPARTTKIRFICENFGMDEAECCIDSIRVHRLSDTFLLEPCQKNILSNI